MLTYFLIEMVGIVCDLDDFKMSLIVLFIFQDPCPLELLGEKGIKMNVFFKENCFIFMFIIE
jgi:hypothetical protein